VRVVSLHPDVLVATSAIWRTNCVIVRGGANAGDGEAGDGGARETFVIDSPVLPDELDALGAVIQQARFPEPTGLLATHGDWDHLLGRLAFPDLALGCAETTAARLAAAPGEAQRELRDFDRSFYVERPRPLQLGQVQALPVPGRLDIGDRELQLHPAEGHTPDGMAISIGWAGVLVLGDYLSTVEPPDVGESGSAETYAATLERLRSLVASATHVVPGHGPVLDAARALGVLDEHVDLLTRLT
jgi:glyoxylase-like metal-dependent hydrolase (beta-lactamase superfamily II)